MLRFFICPACRRAYRAFQQIEADLENIAQADRSKYLDIGWSFFVSGLSKKVLLADIEIP